MNKKNFILDKAKLVCIKLDRIFLVIPYTVSKIELRMRNIIMNNRSTLDGISHFMNFYLINQQFQANLMSEYAAHLRILQEIDYHNTVKIDKKASVKTTFNSNQGTNFTTNFSANNPPIQSGSLADKQSESIINVAVGESAFVNSNVGITIDKH